VNRNAKRWLIVLVIALLVAVVTMVMEYVR
jgi:hypothetical protein